MCILKPYKPRSDPRFHSDLPRIHIAKCFWTESYLRRNRHYCKDCRYGFDRNYALKHNYFHGFFEGPFTPFRCCHCGTEVTVIRPVLDCKDCYPEYCHTFRTLKKLGYDVDNMSVIVYNTDRMEIWKIHFLPSEPPSIEEQREELLEPYYMLPTQSENSTTRNELFFQET